MIYPKYIPVPKPKITKNYWDKQFELWQKKTLSK